MSHLLIQRLWAVMRSLPAHAITPVGRIDGSGPPAYSAAISASRGPGTWATVKVLSMSPALSVASPATSTDASCPHPPLLMLPHLGIDWETGDGWGTTTPVQHAQTKQARFRMHRQAASEYAFARMRCRDAPGNCRILLRDQRHVRNGKIVCMHREALDACASNHCSGTPRFA